MAGSTALPGREGGEREGVSVRHGNVRCNTAKIVWESRYAVGTMSRYGVRDGREFEARLELQAHHWDAAAGKLGPTHTRDGCQGLSPGRVFVRTIFIRCRTLYFVCHRVSL
jgi:hypothetical protein